MAALAAAPLTNGICNDPAAEQPAPSATDDPWKLEALVTPETRVALAAPSEGLVEAVLVKDGQVVQKGQELARLAQEEERIRLEQAELQARQAAEDLEAIRRLYEANAASRDDFTRAQLRARQSDAERDLLAIRLRDRTIRSPVEGHVLRVMKQPGESLQRLEQFAEIAALSRKNLIAFADADAFGRIVPGLPARVVGGNGGEFEGRVDLVDPVLDAGGQSFRITILVPDPENALRAGSRVAVEIPGR